MERSSSASPQGRRPAAEKSQQDFQFSNIVKAPKHAPPIACSHILPILANSASKLWTVGKQLSCFHPFTPTVSTRMRVIVSSSSSLCVYECAKMAVIRLLHGFCSVQVGYSITAMYMHGTYSTRFS